MTRILVVDDEPAVRQLMVVTLEMAGYEVEEAAGGEEALGKIELDGYDLIVLDVMMPITDGYEVLQRVRAMKAHSDTPVIIVTAKGYDAEGMLREASGGVVDHLSKPFDPSDLEIAVARILQASDGDLEKRRRMHTRAAEVYSAINRLRESGVEPEPTRRRR